MIQSLEESFKSLFANDPNSDRLARAAAHGRGAVPPIMDWDAEATATTATATRAAAAPPSAPRAKPLSAQEAEQRLRVAGAVFGMTGQELEVFVNGD